MTDIETVVHQFLEWARNDGIGLAVGDIEVRHLGVPHKPVSLPKGR
jgi:hypothetical protein